MDLDARLARHRRRMAITGALVELAWAADGPLRERLTLAAWRVWEGRYAASAGSPSASR